MKVRWLLALATLLLAGCADPQLGELDRRLTDIRNDPGMPRPLEMPEVPDYAAVPYQASDRRSPFRPQLPEPEAAPRGSSDLAPDPERAREPLEAYDLEALRLVGILTMGGQTNALVRAPGGEVHRLRTGNHLGRNHGRVVGITDSSVQLVELVPTGGGGWMERTARLALEERR
ncbi:pilus assembly protein PilP [Billgrantia desiderata]|jgi:type IV pilus assembly protein PilP|uniref:Pilus assembly protein PilP n=1 Tax=Billgrantia desiderata TaxID=52021 RepID=A0AAW4YR85_9GAMM|nr:pilus assembly protein PilP [Halomonas desiderata]MCE8011110.1 pilus assembly protein PilP [Halomonas desiderata]MCE8050580.1 pilus assembly protein PilP [Halomonas desiderata]NIC39117.1 pilus assembly protein PilP [Halomonas desiderata]OUE43765.1 pilus assembly protein PilQ [Halomonas desiderata SP1]SEG47036.1 type IV pilus assembly protein PilP [Halomonas desiderata]